MIFMAGNHVAENPYHADCLRLIRKLQEAPERQLTHSSLLKLMKMDAKAFREMVSTLEQQGDLLTTFTATAGRPQKAYRLIRGGV
jgi:predicted ArsR family transcriptional regulator